MQYFKGDNIEKKIVSVFEKYFNEIYLAHYNFFENGYNAEKVGEIIYELALTPIVRLIDRDVFTKFLIKILNATRLITYNDYIDFFNSIFNIENIEFVNVNPGHLRININAKNDNIFDLLCENEEELLCEDGDNLLGEDLFWLSPPEYNSIINIYKPYGIFIEYNIHIS